MQDSAGLIHAKLPHDSSLLALDSPPLPGARSASELSCQRAAPRIDDAALPACSTRLARRRTANVLGSHWMPPRQGHVKLAPPQQNCGHQSGCKPRRTWPTSSFPMPAATRRESRRWWPRSRPRLRFAGKEGDSGLAAAERAIALDANLAEGHAAKSRCCSSSGVPTRRPRNSTLRFALTRVIRGQLYRREAAPPAAANSRSDLLLREGTGPDGHGCPCAWHAAVLRSAPMRSRHWESPNAPRSGWPC
jgi:hypothetical protein